MKSAIVVCTAVLILGIAGTGGVVLAQGSLPPPSAPVEWIEIQEGQAPATDELPTGYLPNPLLPPSLALPVEAPQEKGAVGSPPASFDSRPSRATSVKSQGQYGTCWLFASIGDFESKVKIVEIPGVDPDYAEWDVIEGLAEGGTRDTGGNTLQVCNHLSKYAVIDEADNPYQTYPTYPSPQPISNYWAPPAGTPSKNVVKWYNLGNREADPTTIKNTVQNVGPVATAFSVDVVNSWSTGGAGPGYAFNSYNWDSDWVVPYISTANETDHAILIVGWDDNKPWYAGGGYGAWLVKNSWGESWGNGGNGSPDHGYFWIAYGSARIGTDAAVYPQDGWKSYDPAESMFLYDDFGCMTAYGWTGQYTVYLCSRMTPAFTGAKQLNAVDVWIYSANVSYEIKIFDDWNTSYPYVPQNQLGTTETGSLAYAGYYSIPLSAPIALTSGNEVCVQVKLTDTSSTSPYLIPVEINPGWFQNPVHMETNKSYARYSQSNSWGCMDAGNYGVGDIGVRIRYGDAIANPEADFSSSIYSVNEAVGTATITVNLDHAPASSCSVSYATSDGTAVQPGDYTSTSGTLTFTSSETSKQFTVPILNDSNVEPDEGFIVTLSSPSGCTLAGGNNPATVAIDSEDMPSADFSSATYVVNEGDGAFTITVNLNQAPEASCAVLYATSDGTAAQPGDYTNTSGTLTFMTSDTSKQFTVPIIDDSEVESDETLTVTLSSPSGCTLAGASNPATLTITSDDTPSGTVHVDFDWTGAEDGTQANPYNTFAEALANLASGCVIKIKGNATDTQSGWTGTINSPMTLQADPAGTVRIGASGGGS